MAPTATDIVVLSLASFFGNFGVALTGFGQAIVYLFIWQIASLSGYDGLLEVAIFIQAFSLMVVQPLLMYKADVLNFASKRMLIWFIPATLIATPLGQYTAEHVDIEIVILVGAFLVTFIAIFEIYNKWEFFTNLVSHHTNPQKDSSIKVEASYEKVAQIDNAGEHNVADGTSKDALLVIANSLKPAEFSKVPTDEDSDDVNTAVALTSNSTSVGDIEMNEKKKSGFGDSYILGKELGAGSFSIVKEG